MATVVERVSLAGQQLTKTQLDSYLQVDIEMDRAAELVVLAEMQAAVRALSRSHEENGIVIRETGLWVMFGYQVGRLLLGRTGPHLIYSHRPRDAKRNSKKLQREIAGHDFDVLINVIGPVAQFAVGAHMAQWRQGAAFLRGQSEDVGTAIVLSRIGVGLSLALAEEEIFG